MADIDYEDNDGTPQLVVAQWVMETLLQKDFDSSKATKRDDDSWAIPVDPEFISRVAGNQRAGEPLGEAMLRTLQQPMTTRIVTNRVNDLLRLHTLPGHTMRQTGTKLPDGTWEIPLTQDVVDRVGQLAFPGESFSDTIERVIGTIDFGADGQARRGRKKLQ